MIILRRFYILLLAVLAVNMSVCIGVALAAQGDVDIWSPGSVNWWVAESSENDDLCQIHWLYDDEINVYFKQNNENLYYFGFEHIGKQKALSNSFQNENFSTILVVDEEQVNLGVARLDSNKIIATAPSDLNELDMFKQADAIFLKSDKMLYSFPLENVYENFSVYTNCLKDKGQYVTREAALVPVTSAALEETEGQQATGSWQSENTQSKPPSNNTDTAGASLLFGAVDDSAQPDDPSSQVEAASAAAEGPMMAEEIAVAPEDGQTAAATQDLTIPPGLFDRPERPQEEGQPKEKSGQKVTMLSKSKGDYLGDDLSYDYDKDSDNQGKDQSDKENDCGSGKLDSDVNAIIKNLTRKLTILEKEKEAYRMKALATPEQPVISEILACKEAEIDEADIAANEGIIQDYKNLIEGFKVQIEELEAENELLNASIVNQPSMGDISDMPEMSKLKEDVKSLEIKNAQLNKELEQYKEMLRETVPEDTSSEETNDSGQDAPSSSQSSQDSMIESGADNLFPEGFTSDDDLLSEELNWENIEQEVMELTTE